MDEWHTIRVKNNESSGSLKFKFFSTINNYYIYLFYTFTKCKYVLSIFLAVLMVDADDINIEKHMVLMKNYTVMTQIPMSIGGVKNDELLARTGFDRGFSGTHYHFKLCENE